MRSIQKKGKRLKDNHVKKNKQHKKTIIQIIFILITVVLIIFAMQYVLKEIDRREDIKQQEIETKEKEENIKQLSQSRKFENMEVENIKLYEEYGNTYFTAEINNQTKNDFKAKNITINFLDEKEKSIIKFGYYVKDIKAGEKLEIRIITNQDLTKAHDFKIEEQK